MFVGRFTFLLTSFLLAACQPIAGTLTVAERLVLNVTEYERPLDPWCRRGRDRDCKEPVAVVKTGRFHPGSYRAQLELDAKDAIRLTLFEARKLESVVNLTVPRGTHLPQHEGQFRLPADETGQPYDVAGEIATTYAVSPVVTAWQSCAQSLERWVCKNDGAHDNDDEK